MSHPSLCFLVLSFAALAVATVSAAPPAPAAGPTASAGAGAVGPFGDESFSFLFDYPPAGKLELTDLYGDHLSLSDYVGRVVVVSFIDKKSRAEAIRWVESLPTAFLGDDRLVFINVVFPGGISFLVPRRKVVSRLRREIESIRRKFRLSLAPHLRKRLDSTAIRWAADWRRKLSRRWGVVRHKVNVFVVDDQGRLRDSMRGMSADTVSRLSGLLERLLSENPREDRGGS